MAHGLGGYAPAINTYPLFNTKRHCLGHPRNQAKPAAIQNHCEHLVCYRGGSAAIHTYPVISTKYI